jgi:hypothetical protein
MTFLGWHINYFWNNIFFLKIIDHVPCKPWKLGFVFFLNASNNAIASSFCFINFFTSHFQYPSTTVVVSRSVVFFLVEAQNLSF